ncbi:MAG: DUF6456 domain-containing protein [Pseudomonadota bacterium]
MTETQAILDNCAERVRKTLPDNAGPCSPQEAAYYLAHTEQGESIRRLADASGTHPSTVLRAVRRIEQRRDDPLFDRIVSEMEEAPVPTPQIQANIDARPSSGTAPGRLTIEQVRTEAKKFLRRLSEPSAFLMIAPGAQKAGIFGANNDFKKPTALLPVPLAVEFLKQDWIKVSSRSSAAVRYQITDVGRSFLRRTLAEETVDRKPGGGLAEAPVPYLGQHQAMADKLMMDPATGKSSAVRINIGESPIGWLTRRKGPDGKPFLAPEEVDAAERLRTDFETANIGPQVAQDWRKFLTPSDKYSGSPRAGEPGEGPMMARDRVMKALAALGPGLADVALRTCCFLEGLESCERRMGWSSRSGKVVLQIALKRLVEHYGLAPFKS